MRNRRWKHRGLAKWWANGTGYFWIPCPFCGEPFAGWESGRHSLMMDRNSGQAVCTKDFCQLAAKDSEQAAGWFIAD